MTLAMPGAQADTGANPVNLDHVGLIVQDLTAAHAVMACLGFALTARADHTMTTAEGRTVSAGSSQHAIMMAHGYIELMQITDPQAGHHLAAAPVQRYGLHILALDTPDAQASHARLLAKGEAVGPVRRWSRQVIEADRQGLARFVFFDAPWEPQDASYLCWVHHLTPELMRASNSPVHANGALSVKAIHYSGPRTNALAWASRLQQLGLTIRLKTQEHTQLELGQTTVHVRSDLSHAKLIPKLLELCFESLAEIQTRCSANGLLAWMTPEGALLIDLRDTLGIELLCTSVRAGH